MTSSPLATLDRLIEAFTERRKWRALSPIERRLERDMEKAFRKQGRAFLAALNHRAGVLGGRLREAAGDVLPPDWAAIFDAIARDIRAFTPAIQRGVRASLTTGAQHSMTDLGVPGTFDLANPRAVTYLETHAAEAVTAINEATKAEMRAIITKGVREGQSYDQIAKSIKDRFEGFSRRMPQQHIRSRAHLVAVTESGNAYEAGTRAVADDLKAAGLEMEKSWLTVGDKRVSDECMSNEGAGWIPIDDTFPSGADQPLEHPGCRCTMQIRRKPGTRRAA